MRHAGVAVSASGTHPRPIARGRTWPVSMRTFFAMWCLPSLLFAAPADVDLSFVAGVGFASTVIAPGHSSGAQNIAVQPDGKIIAAGSCANSPATPTQSLCIFRYQTNGLLDPSFNASGSPGAGKLLKQIGSPTPPQPGNSGSPGDSMNGLVLQTDGKILVTGGCELYNASTDTTRFGFCAARFHNNGTLDTTFNTTGILTTHPFPGPDGGVYTAAIQSDGKLVVATTCVSGVGIAAMCVARYLTDGTLDTQGFNATAIAPIDRGRVTTSFGNNLSLYPSGGIEMQTDGKIIVAARCERDDAALNRYIDFCLVRYHADGLLDISFIGSVVAGIAPQPGLSRVAIEQYSELQSFHIQPNGKIVVVGTCRIASTTFSRACLSRHHADGPLDTSFGSAGTMIHAMVIPTHTLQPAFYARASAVQTDGKLIIAGNCFGRSSTLPSTTLTDVGCLIRLNADGTPDGGFAATGQASASGRVFAVLPAGSPFTALDIRVQKDGALALSGSAYNPATDRNEVRVTRMQGGPNEFAACSGDIDGDGEINATDSLILARVAHGFNGGAVMQGIPFASHATRKTWPQIRDYLSNHCAMRTPL